MIKVIITDSKINPITGLEKTIILFMKKEESTIIDTLTKLLVINIVDNNTSIFERKIECV